MVHVDLVHDVEDLVLRRVPAKGAHEDAELLGADVPVAVLRKNKSWNTTIFLLTFQNIYIKSM